MDNPLENGDGKLLGIIPHQYEREVAFLAAVLGIIAFVIYQRHSAAATTTGSAAASSGGQDLSGGYTNVSGGSGVPVNNTGTSGLVSNDGTVASQTDLTTATSTINQGIINAITGIQATQTTQAPAGASFSLDLSVLNQGTGNNSYNQSSSKSSGSGGKAGLSIGGFSIGGSGSTQNSSSQSASGGGATSYDQTSNVIGSGANLTETELNSFLATLSQAQRNSQVERDFQSNQNPNSPANTASTPTGPRLYPGGGSGSNAPVNVLTAQPARKG